MEIEEKKVDIVLEVQDGQIDSNMFWGRINDRVLEIVEEQKNVSN